MWCYQKPGFESLLLAGLQRQQQGSQFCDTLLKTDGVSIPAHGCILSAISPHISSALSSMPPPPEGHSRLLEFRTLGDCTLLQMVRLLYSGEMAGEGEKEKQEAISAAAKLGIHGLVEITKTGHKGRSEEDGGRHAEVGVQTEALMPGENERRRSGWRREVRDGSILLWKETLSNGENDVWTQTEELQVNVAAPSHQAVSYETTDMASVQTSGQTAPHSLPPQIPYVPVSLIYPPDGTHASAPVQEPTAAGHTSVAISLLPFSSQVTVCAADPQGWWTGEVAVAKDWENEEVEQFQGNIPGYIDYFLNPDREEGSCRGRPRRRRTAGAGTGGRRARRPRARVGGRGRGGLMKTVDVQDVGVSRLQKLFLLRFGMRVSRTGQGGGAAGRTLYLKTRNLLQPARRCQRRRGRGKVWDFSLGEDVKEGVVAYTQSGRRNTTQQVNQDGLPVRAQAVKTTPTTSGSASSLPMCFYTLSASSPSLQSPPSQDLLSPGASYVSPASSLLHTTPLPPPAPPPDEEQPEHIDRLLEEVMMGLHILPNNNNGAPHSQPQHPTSSSGSTYVSSGNVMAQNEQQGCTTGLLEASSGFCGSVQVLAVSRGAGGSSSANSEVPVLQQQQGPGELNEMLDNFLQSFEQHMDSCTGREQVEMSGHSCTRTTSPHQQNACRPRPVRCSQITELQQNDEAETPLRVSQPCKGSTREATPPKHTKGTAAKVRAPAKRTKRRRKKEYLLSLERKTVRERKPVSSNDAKSKIKYDQGEKQLQQMPVVKLERRSLLADSVTLQGHSCQSLDLKSSAKTKTSSASACPLDSLLEKNQAVSWNTKTYPIRSRFREALIMDSMPFLEVPLPNKPTRSAGRAGGRRGQSKKTTQLPSLSNGESSAPPAQQQPCGMKEQLDRSQDRHEEEVTVWSQEEAKGPRTGEKRGAESNKEASDDAALAKRVCFEHVAEPTSETSADFVCETATDETEDIIDVDTISLTSVGDCFQIEEKPQCSEIVLGETEEREMESSSDEIIDVEGDVDGGYQSGAAPTLSRFVAPVASPTHSEGLASLGSTRSCDVDVIGGSSPAPDPVVISWTESSESEKEEGDEDIDVVGEKTDYSLSSVFAAMNKGEFVNRIYHHVILH